ncbi:hypothetical protein KAR91_32865 [Candidatus Pacearchaeota archaeon]|nr:hypothetical protein [Candidatus Pacearchaeota archaeon]
MTEQNELIVIETAKIPALFKKDGCNPIIEGLKKEAAKFKGDVSTAKGRKEIASFARKFSTAKAYLDGLGKTLSDEYRAKIEPINGERNKIKTCCDELRDEARKPLTDWEDAERKRVADIELRVNHFAEYLEIEFIDSEQIAKRLGEMKSIIIDDSFEEFELAATKAKQSAVTQLEAKFIVLQNAEKEKAEAERLEKERLEKEQKEREEKIAEEAAEAARKEAEEEAAKEAEGKEREEKEEREKLEKEKLQLQLDKEKAERETKEAEENERRLKEDHQKELDDAAAKLRERMDKEEQDKKDAAEQAERDREAAVEAEKKRQAEQAEADRKADEKRQANKRHRNKIIKEINEDIKKWNIANVKFALNEEARQSLIEALIESKIRNVKVEF